MDAVRADSIQRKQSALPCIALAEIPHPKLVPDLNHSAVITDGLRVRCAGRSRPHNYGISRAWILPHKQIQLQSPCERDAVIVEGEQDGLLDSNRRSAIFYLDWQRTTRCCVRIT